MDMTKMDLYALLDILSSATTQEVKKAYRRKALKCHPDKNPDNPKAVEFFHQLSKALEILTDESARAAYDKVINAKKAATLRNRELDSKRKKLKEDLEARERQAQFDAFQEKSAEDKLKAEIERLRKEGSKQLEEEIEFVRIQVQQEKLSNAEPVDSSQFRLKVNWRILKTDTSNDVYNYDCLEKIFSKYGELAALVVSNKKKGSALLEFTSSLAAVKAQKHEKGFLSNPLTVSWLNGPPPSCVPRHRDETVRSNNSTHPVSGTSIFPSMPATQTQCSTFPCFPPAPDIFTKKIQEKQDIDFESMVLSRMRQAEEEKRRAAQGQKENEES